MGESAGRETEGNRRVSLPAWPTPQSFTASVEPQTGELPKEGGTDVLT